MRPESDDDWLLVAGDVAETVADIRWALETLAGRFAQGRLGARQPRAVDPPRATRSPCAASRATSTWSSCAGSWASLTPEDPYPVWEGPGGPVAVAPLFLLYDYSFLPPGCATKEEGLAYAHGTGVVCTDEHLLHPDPYPSREAWCRARVAETERRLAELPRRPARRCWSTTTRWSGTPRTSCGTPSSPCGAAPTLTADWHRRFRVETMVYGHLHIPRTTWHDGRPLRRGVRGLPPRVAHAPGTAGHGCAGFCRWRSGAGDRGAAPGVGGGRGGLRSTTRPTDAALFPEEEALVARAVAKRRREFTAVRACARRAMEKLGVPPQPDRCPASAAPRGGRTGWSAA